MADTNYIISATELLVFYCVPPVVIILLVVGWWLMHRHFTKKIDKAMMTLKDIEGLQASNNESKTEYSILFFTLLGMLLSGLTLYVFYLMYLNFSPEQLNKLGGFISAAASSLAFVWLVLGYIQQNMSLRTQIKELRSSVKAQRDSADGITGQYDLQLQDRKRSQPKFVCKHYKCGFSTKMSTEVDVYQFVEHYDLGFDIFIHNTGGTASVLAIEYKSDVMEFSKKQTYDSAIDSTIKFSCNQWIPKSEIADIDTYLDDYKKGILTIFFNNSYGSGIQHYLVEKVGERYNNEHKLTLIDEPHNNL